MKLHLNVNKATFGRVLSGEQDELFLKQDYHWSRKLYHPRRFGHFRPLHTVTISNGTKDRRRIIRAKVLCISIKPGRPEFGLPEELMFYIKIAEPTELFPPFNSYLIGESVRNRIK